MPDDNHASESEMIKRVRQWRREAYEETRSLSAEERGRRADDLCRQLGLDLPATKGSKKRRRKSA